MFTALKESESAFILLFFSSRRRHTSFSRDWSSDVCSSDLVYELVASRAHVAGVDVRTGGVSLVVADITGAIAASASVRVTGDDASAVGATVEALDRAVRRTGDTTPHTVAVGAPGLIDPATGQLRATPGLPRWHAV